MSRTSENKLQAVEVVEVFPNRRGYSRRPTLTTARGIRKELAATYLEFRRGEIDEPHAKTATFILRTALEAVAATEIEARLDALEGKTINIEGEIEC
jgi:hypothetical protein